jgi:hypothetical protein
MVLSSTTAPMVALLVLIVESSRWQTSQTEHYINIEGIGDHIIAK